MISRTSRDWYRTHIRPDSVSFEAIGLLRYRPRLYRNLVKKLGERHPHENICRDVERMRERGHVAVADGRVRATDKGMLLYTASLMGIRPMAFMILSFAYVHVRNVGFFVRDYDEYYTLGHTPLLEKQLTDAFGFLVRKGLVCRHRTLAGLWTIPDGKMDMLRRHHDILSKSVEVTRGV